MLLPEIERQQRLGKEVVFRADAAFAKPEIYEVLEERGRQVCDPHSVQRKSGAGHRGVVDAARRQTKRQAGGLVQKFPVPGGELEDGTAGRGEKSNFTSGSCFPAWGSS